MNPTAAPSPATSLRSRGKERRIRQILEATRTLLRENPDESPSVERIAARAEVAPATVFNLIGPREQIWASLVDDLLAEVERRTADLRDRDPHARARSIAAKTIEIVRADAAVYRHVLANWKSSGRLLRHDPTRQLVACLRAAADAGQLRPDLDHKALAETITTTCTGAAHQWAAGMIDDDGLHQRCQIAVDLAFAAASTQPASRDYLSALKPRRSKPGRQPRGGARPRRRDEPQASRD